MLNKKQLKQAIKDFEDQEYFAILDRESAARRIKAAEEEIINSYNRNHYSAIYKPEYGDYDKFVERLAKELRKRDT